MEKQYWRRNSNFVASYFKCSRQFYEDKELINKYIKSEIKKIKSDMSSIGIRVFKYRFDSAYDGDDFVKDMKTFLFKFKAYKKPRFIK